MSVTSAVVAVIAGDARLDDASVIRVHNLEIDAMTGVAPPARERHSRRCVENIRGNIAPIAKMPRDGFSDQRPEFVFFHDRRDCAPFDRFGV